MSCKIDRGSAFDCASTVQGGIGDYALMINHEDLSNGAITEDEISLEIETITLDSGTYAYKFESSKGSAQIIPTSPLRAVSSIDGFDHQVDIRVLDVSQLSIENVSKLRFQKVAVIIPLASGKSLLYGRSVGMRISDFQMMPGDADTGGSMQVVIKTPENDPPELNAPDIIASTFDILTLLQT